jgi:hypothetical protein
MKAFMLRETRNALKRLEQTIIFITRTIFIAIVNVVFWLLPLFLMGYLAFKPMVHWISDVNSGGRPSASSGNYPNGQVYPVRRSQIFDLREIRRSIEYLLRELKFMKRT